MTRLINYVNAHKKTFMVILLVVALTLPLVCRVEYVRTILVKMLIMMIFASALNITNGYSGMFNLGVSSFMCISCYTTALIAKAYRPPFLLVLLISCVVTSVFGLLIVLPTFRLTGMFFSIVTLGIAETVRVIALNWNSFTNGPLGINAIPSPRIFGWAIKSSLQYYYLTLIFLTLTVFCVRRLLDSRVGMAWISIRENQDAARSLGVNVARYKVINVMCSAFFCGIGGCLFAYYYRFIEPGNFTIDRGHEVLAMVVLGGQGALAGPIAGAFIITLFTEALRFASEYRMVFYGALIILVMWFRPQGLVGTSGGGISLRKGGMGSMRGSGRQLSGKGAR